MSDSNFINEVKTELQKAVGGGKTALGEVNALKSRVMALEGVKPKAHLIETWRNGASWYRKYSDGFIEQGGRGGSVSAFNGTVSVTFNKYFTSNNYTITLAGTIIKAGVGSNAFRVLQGFSNSSFNIIDTDSNSRQFFWYACGY